jgi:hypothetical protein
VGFGGYEEVRDDGFEGVVGAEDVDVDYRFEGVGGEFLEGGEEVACCAGAGGISQRSSANSECKLSSYSLRGSKAYMQ